MNSGWKKDYLRYKDFFLSVASVYRTKPNLKIYLELILSIATIIIFLLFAIKPTILTVIDLTKEIKAKEETVSNLKQKIKNLQTANNLMQNESANINFINQAVPNNANPDTLIKQLEDIAKENSLQILNISSSDITLSGVNSKDTSDQSELTFTFSATGSYQSLLSSLLKLENLRRPVKFDSFTINSNVTENGKRLVLTIVSKVPYLSK